MAIYMNYDGLAVKGSVTSKGFEDWIELDSVSVNMMRHMEMTTGAVKDRGSNLPQFTEVNATKPADASSYGLMNAAINDGAGKEIKIAITKQVKDMPEAFTEYTLTNGVLSVFGQSSAGSDKPYENLAISYTKIEVAFKTFDEAGAVTKTDRVNFNLATSKPD
jgi:type VI secretion system secreted protein Hcp